MVQFVSHYNKHINSKPKKILRKRFSCSAYRCTDKNPKVKLLKEIMDISEDIRTLDKDREAAYKYTVGITKTAKGQQQTETESESISHIRETYPSFFDSSSEDESTSNDPDSKMIAEKEKISGLLRYLKMEKESYKAQYAKLIRDNPDSFTSNSEGKTILKPEYFESIKEEEKSDNVGLDDTSSDKGKGKASESASDFIDNLPKDHNPFDDIGSD